MLLFFILVPFACTQGGGIPAALECMTQPEVVDPDALEEITDLGADAGNIDATANMKNDKVYIFNGELDTVVNPGNNDNNVVVKYHPYATMIDDPNNRSFI